jgi:hypothetical protein
MEIHGNYWKRKYNSALTPGRLEVGIWKCFVRSSYSSIAVLIYNL